MNPRINLTRSQILRLLDGYPIQLPTEVGLLELAATRDDAWQPMRRVRVNPVLDDRHAQFGIKAASEAWVNNIYDCIVTHDGESGVTHLSIKRLDRAPIRNWRHFQQIKNEVVGEEREGVEIFPAESRLADNANQYHLWILPDGMPIPLGFPSGMVVMDEDDVETFNRNGEKSRQEPLQEGLTIGEKMQVAQDNMSDDAKEIVQRVIRGGRG